MLFLGDVATLGLLHAHVWRLHVRTWREKMLLTARMLKTWDFNTQSSDVHVHAERAAKPPYYFCWLRNRTSMQSETSRVDGHILNWKKTINLCLINLQIDTVIVSLRSLLTQRYFFRVEYSCVYLAIQSNQSKKTPLTFPSPATWNSASVRKTTMCLALGSQPINSLKQENKNRKW